MERVFPMPDLGEGLEGGRIVEWLVDVGDEVTLNQPLVEIETAKAAVEIPSPLAGSISALHGRAGEDVSVGAPLITFEVARQPVEAARATPPVRKLAKELGLDIDAVNGTGRDGRITEADVERFAERTQRLDAEGVFAVAVHHELGSRLEPVGAVRQEIAAALTQQATIPQATTFRTVDCAALEEVRRAAGSSPLPFVIAALCAVARDHPLMNAAWREDMLEFRDVVNVGVAVDTDRGLLVPVVQDAGRRGVTEIASEIARLADAARADRLTLEYKLATATIAVSNTGSYGSEAGTPILSPDTSMTLAFGAIEPRALVQGGAVVARPAATISCTFDHRVLGGAAAGRALTDVVALLESPERLGGLPR
jgi:pyruvate/2-oxoglutarate dehydrogenase complex dihydrolipoamide acyltransferase (E2) component